MNYYNYNLFLLFKFILFKLFKNITLRIGLYDMVTTSDV